MLTALGHAQIPQNQPELCGRPGQTIPVPEGTTFSYSADGAPANLTMTIKDGSAKTVDLGVADAIPQVCPIAGNRLLVFGNVAGEDGPHVWIMNQVDGRVIDHIGSRGPVLSPDQRWLMYRQFYPPRVQIVTENYLLYDLAKDAAGNREWDGDPGYPRPEGREVYPVTANNIPLHPMDKLEPLHDFTSESFYWSSDSRFVAFADFTGHTESIVLVRVGDRDLTTYVHPLRDSEICEGGSQTAYTIQAATLHSVEFLPAASSLPGVWAHFSNIPCRHPLSQPLRLHAEDFKPAEIELHERIRPPKK